jgi:hypothetical protein
VKHNLKKNEIPIIVNFRKSRVATKAHGLQEMPKGEDTFSGNTTTAVVRTTQGGPHSNENISTIGQETPPCVEGSAGLADQFDSSLMFQSDELMEKHCEMMDEEFISAGESSDETIIPTHPPMPPGNFIHFLPPSH